MNDPLRIDLALARAAGLPVRSANDGSASLVPPETTLQTPPSTLFSPLSLLLARFLPTDGAPAPVPTPEEARLLQGYLQQRVVAVLHPAGMPVPTTLRVAVDAAGVLHLTPRPGQGEGAVTSLLVRDVDIARLVDVLRRAASATPQIDARALAAISTHAAPSRASSLDGPDPRRAWWPWRMAAESAGERPASRPSLLPAVYLGVAAALLLGWWLIS